jgi:hypothetical protein
VCPVKDPLRHLRREVKVTFWAIPKKLDWENLSRMKC